MDDDLTPPSNIEQQARAWRALSAHPVFHSFDDAPGEGDTSYLDWQLGVLSMLAGVESRAAAIEEELEQKEVELREAEEENDKLVASHAEALLAAQTNALDTINRLAEQLPAVQHARARDVTAHYSITISRQLDTIRDQIDKIERVENERDENAKNLSLAFADQAALRRELRSSQTRTEQLELQEGDAADAREESTEVIRKCNEQLAAMAAAAKLRTQQVEKLSRLWLAAFEETCSPVGATITRQLYRVMADHGIDVSSLPDPPTTDIADCA